MTESVDSSVPEAAGTISGRVDIDPGRVQGRWRDRAARYETPSTWNICHVDHRLVAAFEVLLRLPVRTRPREFGNAMPAYRHEWADYVAQAEGEREARRHYNRLIYRHKGATADEVAAMDQALAWPMTYLAHDAEVSRAVQLASLWKALEVDFGRRLDRLHTSRATFFRRRKIGLETIVAGLTAARITVV